MELDSRLASRFFAAALALFILISGLTDVVRLWQPIGWFGTVTNSDFVITGVAPGTPADLARIRAGDRFDIPQLPPQERWYLFPQNCLAPGITLTVGVIRNGRERLVTMTSVQEPMGAPQQTALVISQVTGLLFVLIGLFTVLARPSPVVWGFFVYCLGSAPFFYRYLDGTLKLPYSFIWLSAIFIVASSALPGLLIFSVSILEESVTGWRAVAKRIAWAAFAVLAGLNLWSLTRNYLLGQPALSLNMVGNDLRIVLSLAIAAILFATYVREEGSNRQRLRWMCIGIGVALFTPYLRRLFPALAVSSPALFDALSVVGAAAPVGVAYAIIKHRVINVSFFVSRTIVYGVITAILVAAFAFIDWFADRVLDQSKIAVVFEVLVAVGFGFSMKALHRQVDRLVDNVLFRARHMAERALNRITSGLPHAASYEVVDGILAEETAAILRLASAALFRRTAPNRFVRTASIGWDKEDAHSLSEQDRLLVYLAGERQSLRLSDVHWTDPRLPTGTAEPVLALPIFVRHELNAILVLGGHVTGEDLDADEIRLLEQCAVAAGAAYDHVEADALRRQIEELRQMIATMKPALQSQGVMRVLPEGV